MGKILYVFTKVKLSGWLLPKNYENILKSVKVMYSKLWALFSGHRVYTYWVTSRRQFSAIALLQSETHRDITVALLNFEKLFDVFQKPNSNTAYRTPDQWRSQEVRVGTGNLGSSSRRSRDGAPVRVWGQSPQKPESLQLSNAFLCRFVAESVLYLPYPPPKKKRRIP